MVFCGKEAANLSLFQTLFGTIAKIARCGSQEARC